MIIKSFEINKINFDQNKLVLFYGKNEGFKNEATNNLIKEKDEVTKYEEKEVLENINNFIESILSKSLFESEKIIIIKNINIGMGLKLSFPLFHNKRAIITGSK